VTELPADRPGEPAPAAPKHHFPIWAALIVIIGVVIAIVGAVGAITVLNDLNDEDTSLVGGLGSTSAIKWEAVAPLLSVTALGVLIAAVGVVGGRLVIQRSL
jgi:hypothetical protein